MTLDDRDFGFDEALDEGAGERAERGKYETWRAIDPLHQQVMTVLARHAGQEAEQRLWLGVIEQALVDEFLLGSSLAEMEPAERRWHRCGYTRRFLHSAACSRVCDLAGLQPAFFRRVLRLYERARERECRA
ncbi:MAG: hypothetical protein JNM50_04055 [Chromatiales bacterium]|nr:hypothetical protein [Chromatiales bacterium]